VPVYVCSHLLTPQGIGAGAVAFRDGMIAAVGSPREVLRECGDADVRDLGNAILMPGLVNAHTHLELSSMGRDRPPGGDYLTWLEKLLERRTNEDAGVARCAAEEARDALVARGTVAVGDICNDTWIADVWHDAPLGGALFHELLGLDDEGADDLFEAAQQRVDMRPAPNGWRWSLAPHAPHTTSPGLLRRLARHAANQRLPISIHLAESAGETALLADGGGEFREFFERRGFLGRGYKAARCTPFERVEAAGLLGPRLLAVHSIRLSAAEIQQIGESGATVVTCPRSNAYLGVGKAPIPALLDAGAGLALGTDSLASTTDLDVFAEMAAMARLYPQLAPAVIVRAATLGGAAALGLEAELGTISPGKLARLAVVPFSGGGDPLEYLCSCPQHVFPVDDAPYEPA